MLKSAIICKDYVETMHVLVNLIQNAKRTLLYSTYLCLLDTNLGESNYTGSCDYLPNVTMRELLQQATTRGVKVDILYNPATSYGNVELSEFKAALPKENCSLFTCKGDGKLKGIMALGSPHATYTYHHQKYLLVDDEFAMVTGTDMNCERHGWGVKNKKGYFWHEFSIVFPLSTLSPARRAALLTFFKNSIKKTCTPPLPLVNSEREASLINHMIQTSRNSIHIEQQMFVSAGSTCNKVARCIVDRITRAVFKNENFCCVILTNANNPDESPVLNFFLYIMLTWSIRFMENYATSVCGITTEQLYKHLALASLVNRTNSVDGEVPIKIHSNCVIQDEKIMLRSSSNMCDRSLSKKPCDTELGVLVGDAANVGKALGEMTSRYIGQDIRVPYADFFGLVKRNAGFLKVITGRYTEDVSSKDMLISLAKTLEKMPFKNFDKLLALINRHPMMGGKRRAHFKINEVL